MSYSIKLREMLDFPTETKNLEKVWNLERGIKSLVMVEEREIFEIFS